MIGPAECQCRHRQRDVLTILVVQATNLPRVPSLIDNVKVELIPEGQSSKLWSWEFRDRAEIQSVDREANWVEDNEDCSHAPEDRR